MTALPHTEFFCVPRLICPPWPLPLPWVLVPSRNVHFVGALSVHVTGSFWHLLRPELACISSHKLLHLFTSLGDNLHFLAVHRQGVALANCFFGTVPPLSLPPAASLWAAFACTAWPRPQRRPALTGRCHYQSQRGILYNIIRIKWKNRFCPLITIDLHNTSYLEMLIY